tara:strand:- start:16450 stop:18126 length:1677 start_codon:yes stop_codon:yes gene_type:complete
MKLIECVPNFSEGKDNSFVNELKNIVINSENVHFLDIDPGSDTNRTVLTFVGEPSFVIDAAYKLIKYASEYIDMSTHKGEHPRMGATDVCPLIPLQNVSMNDCIKYSKILAKKVGDQLNIPVFLYEYSAKNKERINLSNIRKGEYEGMQEKLSNDNWKPDFGPNKFNKKSGVTAIGAREFLIAYNINLNTIDKKVATDIALDIREAGRLKRDKNGKIIRDKNGVGLKKPGKFKYCKAVGWYIEEYNQAQVSINLTNYKKTSIYKVFEEVRVQARKRGFRVTGSEIVGLLPKKALFDSGVYYLNKQKKSIGIPELDIFNIAVKSLGLTDISEFNVKDKVIEYSVKEDDSNLSDYTINDFSNELSRNTYAPGGGSVSALLGLLGSSLSCMVSNLTYDNKKFKEFQSIHYESSEKLQKYSSELLYLINEDTIAYNNIISARRLPKKTKSQTLLRNKEINKSIIYAIEVPLKVLETCLKVHEVTYKVLKHANLNCISDIGVANQSLYSASNGASYNILINLEDLNPNLEKKYKEKIDYYMKQINSFYLKINMVLNKELKIDL